MMDLLIMVLDAPDKTLRRNHLSRNAAPRLAQPKTGASRELFLRNCQEFVRAGYLSRSGALE